MCTVLEKEFSGKMITVQYATYGQKPTVQPVLLSQKAGNGNGNGSGNGQQMMPMSMGRPMQMMPYGGGMTGMSMMGGAQMGMQGATERPNDWVCGMCNNINFHWRTECNRCKTTRNDSNSHPAPCLLLHFHFTCPHSLLDRLPFCFTKRIKTNTCTRRTECAFVLCLVSSAL